jgi:hypothetical protein
VIGVGIIDGGGGGVLAAAKPRIAGVCMALPMASNPTDTGSPSPMVRRLFIQDSLRFSLRLGSHSRRVRPCARRCINAARLIPVPVCTRGTNTVPAGPHTGWMSGESQPLVALVIPPFAHAARKVVPRMGFFTPIIQMGSSSVNEFFIASSHCIQVPFIMFHYMERYDPFGCNTVPGSSAESA